MRGVKVGWRDENHHNSIEGAILRGNAKISHSDFRGKDSTMKVT
jgi:hypothetical protein